MKRKIILITSILLVFGFLGCAKPPVEEMNSAIEAVTRAENDADAVMYAGSSLARARDALKRMQTEADSKRYDAARTAAGEAIAAAEKAVADGRTGAARTRDEASSLLASLREAIAETEQAIHSAWSAGLPLDFAQLERDFDAVRLAADQADIALAGNMYLEALEKARAARAGLTEINHRLTVTATSVSGKK